MLELDNVFARVDKIGPRLPQGLGDKVDEAHLALGDQRRGPVVERADLQVHLALPVPLRPELFHQPIRPHLGRVPVLGRAAQVRAVHDRAHDEGALLVALAQGVLDVGRGVQLDAFLHWAVRGFQQGVELGEEVHVLRHVRRDDHVDHELPDGHVVLATERLEDVAVLLLHDLERRRDVVVLEHGRVVVQDRERVVRLDEEAVGDSRVVNVVHGGGHEHGKHLEVGEHAAEVLLAEAVVAGVHDVGAVQVVVVLHGRELPVRRVDAAKEPRHRAQVQPQPGHQAALVENLERHKREQAPGLERGQPKDVQVPRVDGVQLLDRGGELLLVRHGDSRPHEHVVKVLRDLDHGPPAVLVLLARRGDGRGFARYALKRPRQLERRPAAALRRHGGGKPDGGRRRVLVKRRDHQAGVVQRLFAQLHQVGELRVERGLRVLRDSRLGQLLQQELRGVPRQRHRPPL